MHTNENALAAQIPHPLFEIPNLVDKNRMARSTVVTSWGLSRRAFRRAPLLPRARPASHDVVLSMQRLRRCRLLPEKHAEASAQCGASGTFWQARCHFGRLVCFYPVANLAPSLGHIRALGPEFYFLIYGIPVLLAVSSSNEDRDTSLFVVIDSLQALFAVVLIYLEL